MTDIDKFDEHEFAKPDHRREINEKRDIYLANGGTIKKVLPPYGMTPPNILQCDVFVPGEGSRQSAPGVKDTLTRIPRPESKFKKRSHG